MEPQPTPDEENDSLKTRKEWHQLGAALFLLTNDHSKEEDLQEARARLGVALHKEANVFHTAMGQACRLLADAPRLAREDLSVQQGRELLRRIQNRYNLMPINRPARSLSPLRRAMETTMKELTDLLFSKKTHLDRTRNAMKEISEEIGL